MNQIQRYISDLQTTLDLLPIQSINKAISILHDARLRKRNIFVMGNGGSASTASHIACDLAKNTRVSTIPHIKITEITDNSAIFSAYGNDEGYENVFVQYLANFLEPDDIVIGISTSGKSLNVLKAIEYSNQIKAFTIGMTGFDGGKLKSIVNTNIHIPSNCIEQIEDIHLIIGHIFCTELRALGYSQTV